MFCIAHDFTAHKAMEKARETFLASFSHEIRTPLNGVLGMLQVISECELDQQTQSYVQQACTSGNLLLNLINDILDLSKVRDAWAISGAAVYSLPLKRFPFCSNNPEHSTRSIPDSWT